MTARVRNWRWVCGAIALLLATVAYADGPARSAKAKKADWQAQTVEMFAAIKSGDIAVKVIPKDSTQCTVMVENKTDKPLTVKLPDAFAASPVLAQAMPGAGAGRGSSNRNGSGSNRQGSQSTGGGMGGMGGGMFNVGPEKVGKLVVPTVCLEHGKPSPRPSIPYEIKTIESVTTKAGVRELCEMVGTGNVDQHAAQAAAWHLNNNMTWQELAAKRIRHANGRTEPYFTQAEIQAAMQIAATASRTAGERKKTESDSETSTSGKSISESSK
ncbi:MAG: hypothetical protein LLG00_15125 [Planctomycetaceae bacterium]|nr:hypothetical protein [Planctomycetaceae bacterium]